MTRCVFVAVASIACTLPALAPGAGRAGGVAQAQAVASSPTAAAPSDSLKVVLLGTGAGPPVNLQQYGASIDMLSDAIKLCPDHLWTGTLWKDTEDARYGQF